MATKSRNSHHRHHYSHSHSSCQHSSHKASPKIVRELETAHEESSIAWSGAGGRDDVRDDAEDNDVIILPATSVSAAENGRRVSVTGGCVASGNADGNSNNGTIVVERNGAGDVIMSYRTPTGGVRYIRPTYSRAESGVDPSAGDSSGGKNPVGFTGVPEFCLNLGMITCCMK